MAETIFKVTTATAAQAPVIVYSDLNGLTYLASSDEVVYNMGAIANHIMNLFLTRQGECDFEPTFGCSIRDLLFELPSSFTTWTINSVILQAFNTWETDVILNTDATAINCSYDQAAVSLGIGVTVKSLNVSNIKLNIEVSL